MSERKSVPGELIDPEFQELDDAITECIRDFVQLGELLIRMRDGQSFRNVGFATFEDYCKSKAGLSIRHARRTINQSLTFNAISKGDINVPLPETAAQVEAMIPVANFATEVKEVATDSGERRTVSQTVGIKNPKKIADQWSSTVKKFNELKAKAEAEGKKPPTLSAKFVRNHLPNDLKITPGRMPSDINPLTRLAGRLEKLHTDISQQGLADARKVPVLMKAEPPFLSAQIPDLVEQAETVVTDLKKLLAIMADYE